MSVRDVIKNSFLNQINTDISTTDVLVVLLATAILGVYLFFIYRMVCKKAFYSKSFAISLVVIALVTSIIIITIQSSVVISLGMVGALSIVRFRTAIKDPMDLAFLFWAISIGIICGANLYEIALEGSLVITFVMLLLYTVPNVQPAHLLLINATDLMAEAEINEILKAFFDEKGLRLVDFKLEFGQDSAGNIILADEISPDSCRLWDKQTNQKLDKDRFRENLGSVKVAYEEVLRRILV